MFLEKCKYVVTEKKILKYIIDDIEISSVSDRENSDEKYSYEENLFFSLYIKMTSSYLKL